MTNAEREAKNNNEECRARNPWVHTRSSHRIGHFGFENRSFETSFADNRQLAAGRMGLISHAYLLYGMQAIVANQIQAFKQFRRVKSRPRSIWTQYCGRCSWLGAVARASIGSVMSPSC
jgi:hypothetical protein